MRPGKIKRAARSLVSGVALMSLALVSASAQRGYYGPRPDAQMEADQPGYEATSDDERLPAEYQKQMVFFRTAEAPGTIIVNTSERFLYLVQGNNRALRYGIGVGRDGFQWFGLKKIERKAEWPDWTPPSEMLKRRPDLPAHMDGGPANPLGARAMYLGSSLYRIHGTNEPETIGKAVSSGCIRMLNDDVIDLYGRVKVGTPVIVI